MPCQQLKLSSWKNGVTKIQELQKYNKNKNQTWFWIWLYKATSLQPVKGLQVSALQLNHWFSFIFGTSKAGHPIGSPVRVDKIIRPNKKPKRARQHSPEWWSGTAGVQSTRMTHSSPVTKQRQMAGHQGPRINTQQPRCRKRLPFKTKVRQRKS